MRRWHLGGRIVIVAIAGVVVGTGVAAAATVGLLVGRANATSSSSSLSDAGPGAALRITAAHGAPLALAGPHGVSPLTVNSSREVPGLNAGLLDGKPASAFSAKGPVAWGFWDQTSLESQLTHGVVGETTLGTGEFCFTLAPGISGTAPVMVTPEYEYSASGDLGAWVAIGLTGCTGANQVPIVTQQYGHYSSSVAFEFVVL